MSWQFRKWIYIPWKSSNVRIWSVRPISDWCSRVCILAPLEWRSWIYVKREGKRRYKYYAIKGNPHPKTATLGLATKDLNDKPKPYFTLAQYKITYSTKVLVCFDSQFLFTIWSQSWKTFIEPHFIIFLISSIFYEVLFCLLLTSDQPIN